MQADLKSKSATYFYASLASVVLGIAWIYPGTKLCAVLGIAGAALIVAAAQSEKPPYLPFYFAGVLFQPFGFYWLPRTVSHFGGFGDIPTAAIFLLFTVLSALQFPIFIFFLRMIRRSGAPPVGAISIAWVFAEVVSIRIFPWCIGHTQLAFSPVAQTADILGAYTPSLLILLSAETLFSISSSRKLSLHHRGMLFAICLLLAYGVVRKAQYSAPAPESQEIALVQANISTEKKGDQRFFVENRAEYARLSASIEGEDTLIIWPESVISSVIPENIYFANRDIRIPQGKNRQQFLVGALTISPQGTYQNSAMPIFNTGEIPIPYHKRILMPFGEYTPLGDILPFLKEIHRVPDFRAGEGAKVFEYPTTEGKSLRVAPLICYEDVISSPAIDSVKLGATLLVNITNDAWFGNTAAPHQHHLIASFRAIETRRFLARSTNTGLTAVVSPLGKTVSQLPVYSEGILLKKVGLYSEIAPYVMVGGERFWWIVIIIGACLSLLKQGINRGSKDIPASSEEI